MFTGIVSSGRAHELVRSGGAARLVVDAGPLAGDVRPGDSVATNGVCLTAVSVSGPLLAFDLVRETLERTSLGDLAAGDRLNLELALRPTDRLGGHFVSGHVDGTGRIARLEAEPGQTVLEVACDAALTAEMVVKGSVALDGVSLTLTGVRPGWLAVALIPHTLEVTNLGSRKLGDRVNIETDLLGKYVIQYLRGVSQGS